MRVRRLLASLVACAAAAGCVSLPDRGPVVESEVTGTGTGTQAMAINPVGPQPGQSPVEIVKGFLDAMQATPLRNDVARQFLTASSRKAWSPNATITYVDASLPRAEARTGTVDISLEGAVQIDDRGAWLGALAEAESERRFRVVRERGQYRIDNPPDVLIVPQTWFAQRFRQVSLYFFDPTSKVLVPDPVFVPRDVDVASILVRRLVAGPADPVRGFVRNLVPGTADPTIAVPVSADGLATIDLRGQDVAVPAADDAVLLEAQLAWTLRQDPSVTTIEVLINGERIRAPADVSTGARYASYVADASSLLFGLRDGVLVDGRPPNFSTVDGIFAEAARPVGAVSVDLPGERAAAVSEDASSLFIASLSGQEPAAPPTALWEGAESLLTPAWDFSGRLWAVDRGTEGATVRYSAQLGGLVDLVVPGVSGEDVKNFLVSRDGSRLVAVIKRRQGDEIVVSRLLQNPAGRVVRALPAQQVDVGDALGLPIRDIAWLTPTSVAVLRPSGPSVFLVRSASLDGAPAGPEDLSVILEGRVTGLIGTPNPGLNAYAVTDEALLDLAGPRGTDVVLDPGLTSLTYVG